MILETPVHEDFAQIPADTVVIGAVPTRWGHFGAAATAAGLCLLTFPGDRATAGEEWLRRWMPEKKVSRGNAPLAVAGEQLSAYIEGGLREFSIPLDLRGTPFRLDVWEAMRQIRFGQTRSYAWLAAQVGRPTAVRAVGSASGANPVPIIVPCHRIIGRDGTLTGYGGGLDLKARLLTLEGVRPSVLDGRHWEDPMSLAARAGQEALW